MTNLVQEAYVKMMAQKPVEISDDIFEAEEITEAEEGAAKAEPAYNQAHFLVKSEKANDVQLGSFKGGHYDTNEQFIEKIGKHHKKRVSDFTKKMKEIGGDVKVKHVEAETGKPGKMTGVQHHIHNTLIYHNGKPVAQIHTSGELSNKHQWSDRANKVSSYVSPIHKGALEFHKEFLKKAKSLGAEVDERDKTFKNQMYYFAKMGVRQVRHQGHGSQSSVYVQQKRLISNPEKRTHEVKDDVSVYD